MNQEKDLENIKKAIEVLAAYVEKGNDGQAKAIALAALLEEKGIITSDEFFNMEKRVVELLKQKENKSSS